MSSLSPFASFWQAGFEAACQINRQGRRLDLIAATDHDRQAEADYRRLRALGLLTARDGVRWHLIDRAGRLDFASLAPMAEAAARQGIQIIWSLFHYGWPDDLELLSDSFIPRFAAFCAETARFLAPYHVRPPVYVPLNEISFFSWAAGDMAFMHPFWKGRAALIKRHLVRAAIAGMQAIRTVDARARFMHTEPLIHVLAPANRPDLRALAAAKTASQFEVWDMLSGRIAPELGGAAVHLDLMGVNFYPPNQWEYPDRPLRWSPGLRDPRWLPLHQMLADLHRRYQRPIVVAETSHLDRERGPWLADVAAETLLARAADLPVWGACLYPAISRPDWDAPDRWHHSGLWDVRPGPDGPLTRMLVDDYARTLATAMQIEPTPEQHHG